MREHFLCAEPTHSVWNNLLEPRLTVNSGDAVQMACLDASGGQVTPASTLHEYLVIDRARVHALTGPISIRGADAGDVLEVEVLEVCHKGWAWSSIIPGLGLLDERFNEAFLFHWLLEETKTSSLHPAIVPLRPFCGVMGVARGKAGEFRTRAPGRFGGNLDVRELTAGATLYLPVETAGALFSAGDAHAAQGDGEVCINGMEMPADVTLRFKLHKGKHLAGPMVESAECQTPAGAEWIVVESGEDYAIAARNATSRMIDLLVDHWNFSPIHAYLLCSVAMNLRLSQVVNRPMVTISAAIPKSILPVRALF